MIRRLVAVSMALAVPIPALACYTPVLPGIHRTGIEYVRVEVDSSAAQMVAGGSASVVDGFHQWNQAPCKGDEAASWIEPFPVFSSTLGGAIVQVRRSDRLSSAFLGPGGLPATDTCASIGLSTASDNATIRLHSRIRRDDGVIYDCNWDSPERTALLVAHELGHYLGLKESGCAGSIMGPTPIQWNSSTGTATFLMAGHAVRDYECQKADEISITPTESDYEEQQCFDDPSCDPYAPCWSDPGCTCPILLDLERDRFHLAGADDPVFFDIDADGQAELVTWTAAGSDDAFLCWDRNGNGRIDDGSELFGNSTRLTDDSVAPFGYIALSELDAPWNGGNSDGVIDPDDAIYEHLCLWTDWDHDGVSRSGELETLSSAGVVAIGVDWTTRPRRDGAGNLFLYHGLAELERNGKTVIVPTTDVYFVEVELDRD